MEEKPTVRMGAGMRLSDFIEKVVIALLNVDRMSQAIEFNKRAHQLSSAKEVIELSQNYVNLSRSKNCKLGL